MENDKIENKTPDGFEESICTDSDCVESEIHYHRPFKPLYLYCVPCAYKYKKDAQLIFKKCTIIGLYHGQFSIDRWECRSCSYQLDSSHCIKLYRFTGQWGREEMNYHEWAKNASPYANALPPQITCSTCLQGGKDYERGNSMLFNPLMCYSCLAKGQMQGKYADSSHYNATKAGLNNSLKDKG